MYNGSLKIKIQTNRKEYLLKGLFFFSHYIIVCTISICIDHSLCDNLLNASVFNGIRHEK